MPKIAKSNQLRPFRVITTIEGKRRSVSSTSSYTAQRAQLMSPASKAGKTRSGGSAKIG